MRIAMRMKHCLPVFWLIAVLSAPASGQENPAQQPSDTIKLAEIHMRDVCILPDPVSKTYYMIGPGRRNSVRLDDEKAEARRRESAGSGPAMTRR